MSLRPETEGRPLKPRLNIAQMMINIWASENINHSRLHRTSRMHTYNIGKSNSTKNIGMRQYLPLYLAIIPSRVLLCLLTFAYETHTSKQSFQVDQVHNKLTTCLKQKNILDKGKSSIIGTHPRGLISEGACLGSSRNTANMLAIQATTIWLNISVSFALIMSVEFGCVEWAIGRPSGRDWEANSAEKTSQHTSTRGSATVYAYSSSWKALALYTAAHFSRKPAVFQQALVSLCLQTSYSIH